MYYAEENDSLYTVVEKIQCILRTNNQGYGILRYKNIDTTVSVDSNPDDIAMIFHLKCEIAKLRGINYE